jgi:TonB family protein
MKPSTTSETDAQMLDHNVQRTVAISALRKIRKLVNQFQAEEAAAARFGRRFLVGLGFFLVALALVVFFSGPGTVERSLTATLPRNSPAPPETMPLDAPKRPKVFTVVGDQVSDYHVASYIESWSQHMGAFGQDRFPSVLSEKKLYGTCELSMTVLANGTLESVIISKSSGYPELDELALALVKGAAPFPPFSPELRKHVDTLEFTRALYFLPSDGKK